VRNFSWEKRLGPTVFISVGIDLKELGEVSGRNVCKFCPGIEVYGRFSLKNERL